MSLPAGAARMAFTPRDWEDAVKESKSFRPSVMRCPGCRQAWLVAGARRGEAYLCKRCGTRLIAGVPAPPPNLRPVGTKAKAREEVLGGV